MCRFLNILTLARPSGRNKNDTVVEILQLVGIPLNTVLLARDRMGVKHVYTKL